MYNIPLVVLWACGTTIATAALCNLCSVRPACFRKVASPRISPSATPHVRPQEKWEGAALYRYGTVDVAIERCFGIVQSVPSGLHRQLGELCGCVHLCKQLHAQVFRHPHTLMLASANVEPLFFVAISVQICLTHCLFRFKPCALPQSRPPCRVLRGANTLFKDASALLDALKDTSYATAIFEASATVETPAT